MADHVAPALEAILMVAEEPLPPALLAKLVGAPINEVEEIARTWRPSTSPTDEDSSWPALRGISLPDRHRAGALRRTFRSRWPVGSAVGGGAGRLP